MKNIIKYGGALIPYSIGLISIFFMGDVGVLDIRYLIALPFSLFITIPALIYWVNKIDNYLK